MRYFALGDETSYQESTLLFQRSSSAGQCTSWWVFTKPGYRRVVSPSRRRSDAPRGAAWLPARRLPPGSGQAADTFLWTARHDPRPAAVLTVPESVPGSRDSGGVIDPNRTYPSVGDMADGQRIGVLALQGSFQEHCVMLGKIGVTAVEVCALEALQCCSSQMQELCSDCLAIRLFAAPSDTFRTVY